MAELMLPQFLTDSGITADSAGIRGLPQHPIDPYSARLLAHAHIDATAFRSKRLTPQIADAADLILGFEPWHVSEVESLAPSKARRTFLLTDFANICDHCFQHGLLTSSTAQNRLISAAEHASLIRPFLPKAQAILDPYRQNYAVFVEIGNAIRHALTRIAHATAGYCQETS